MGLILSDNLVRVYRKDLERARPYTEEERKRYRYPEMGEYFVDVVYEYTDREKATYAMDELKAAGLWTEEDEAKAFG